MSSRLLIVVNDPAFFLSHRLQVAQAALAEGWEVMVASAPGKAVARIRAEGMVHHVLPLNPTGRNPLAELRLFTALYRLCRRLQPDIVHLVTVKPIIYGGIVSRLLGIPATVYAISGMGYLFTDKRKSILRRLTERLYRLSLGHPNSRVIVQNSVDRETLLTLSAAHVDQLVLIPGSGVDLETFAHRPLQNRVEPLVVLPARMLWDKGIGEFVKAARILRKRGVKARFVLVGSSNTGNPSAISVRVLEGWVNTGDVEWWGRRDDMPAVLTKSSLVVLPSYYREGVPKALLEALAVGRAVVTTDAPGCRDVVEPGVNGLLVPARDTDALARAIGELLSDPELLAEMGRQGRAKAEAEFDVKQVVRAHLKIYEGLLATTEVNR